MKPVKYGLGIRRSREADKDLAIMELLINAAQRQMEDYLRLPREEYEKRYPPPPVFDDDECCPYCGR